MYFDYHIHTEYSDDSEYGMEQVVIDAVSLGLEEICFTDHIDYGIKRDWDDPRGLEYRCGGPGKPEKMPLANIDYPRYAKQIADLKDKPSCASSALPQIKVVSAFGIPEFMPPRRRTFIVMTALCQKDSAQNALMNAVKAEL